MHLCGFALYVQDIDGTRAFRTGRLTSTPQQCSDSFAEIASQYYCANRAPAVSMEGGQYYDAHPTLHACSRAVRPNHVWRCVCADPARAERLLCGASGG